MASKDILIVEDDSTAQIELFAILTKAGFTNLKLATSLHEAQQSLELASPALILLDWILPDACGLELLNSIQSASRSIPIVVITGAPSSDRVIAALANGCRGYLTKPVRPEQLLGKIVGILDEH